MNLRNLSTITLGAAFLVGCAANPPPRHYSSGAYGGEYRTVCANCGVVERIERVYGQRDSSGGGAVLGAIIGGVVGNQVGSGSGRKAATAAGAIAGGVAGNRIERDVNAAPRYEIFVRMDDGRRLVITQPELNGIREGAWVQLRGSRAYLR